MSEFNLKSGNTTPFKLMGSSPAKGFMGAALSAVGKKVAKGVRSVSRKPKNNYQIQI